MVKVHSVPKSGPLRVRLTKQTSHCNSRTFPLIENAQTKNSIRRTTIGYNLQDHRSSSCYQVTRRRWSNFEFCTFLYDGTKGAPLTK